MSDRVVRCPSYHRESLLVREGSTWCFSGCSYFAPIDEPKESGTVPEPAPRAAVAAFPAPSEPVSLVRSAPTTATQRPAWADIDDRDDWSSPSEALL